MKKNQAFGLYPEWMKPNKYKFEKPKLHIKSQYNFRSSVAQKMFTLKN